MTNSLDLVLDAKAILGEGAIWSVPEQILYWVDIEGKRVHVFDPAIGSNRTFDIGQPVGTVVPRASGGVTLAIHHGFAHLDLATGTLEFIVDPEPDSPNRFNDGKCDPSGRFWAGTMPYDPGAPPDGAALWCLHPNGTVERKVTGVRCSNGIAWSLDATTMYYIDTPTSEVRAYDFDSATGAISNPRVAISVPRSDGWPDGMTIDAEGMLWVAHWDGWQVVRWNPITGEKMAKIHVPAARVTSCAFGGPDLLDLYITTARSGLAEEQLAKQPHAGGIFGVRPGARGVPSFAFAG